MKNTLWLRILFIIGVLLFFTGTIDPMEGAVLIAGGSVLMALSARLRGDRHVNIFLLAMVLILFGVFFLFYFSSLGGFGGSSDLSWWWTALILPYPIGWLLILGTLIYRWIKRNKAKSNP